RDGHVTGVQTCALPILEITYALGAEMLVLGGAAVSLDDARRAMECAIADGRAAQKFREIIECQGGNPHVVDDPAILPQAPRRDVYAASRDGVVVRVEPKGIGRGIIALGGGRTRVEDTVDPA